ncbi:Transmembrane adaptor Erv26, putative [Trypanosoma equiperdum]|uniref:Transmembrane adaptor Erv26 n=2 Tax=Trypanozoon TaxID=39700 RepID=Q586R2_TRYB2|nr:hypothetical protein, conserved [Trypanosoma brucei brucei TREU927]AAQ15920.1 hypothetical protein, conserved [Trypanosoma brucei brucei TREU927]AAX80174.1 hypothetical protein, conserved [Trypanosoma brucei]SCU66957.1 Transmembrane adaptor Erv26, putative [Trypanosoma equiperdum]
MPYPDVYERDYSSLSQPIGFGAFHLVTLVMTGILFCFALFSFFCAMNLISDLAEEFPTRAGKVLRVLVVAVMGAHVFIMVVDRMNFLCSLVSCITNGLYLRALRHFPLLPLLQPFTWFMGFFVLLESVLWLHLLVSLDAPSEVVGYGNMFVFMIMLWLVPTGLILSVEVGPCGISDGLQMLRPPQGTKLPADQSGKRATIVSSLRKYFFSKS